MSSNGSLRNYEPKKGIQNFFVSIDYEHRKDFALGTWFSTNLIHTSEDLISHLLNRISGKEWPRFEGSKLREIVEQFNEPEIPAGKSDQVLEESAASKESEKRFKKNIKEWYLPGNNGLLVVGRTPTGKQIMVCPLCSIRFPLKDFEGHVETCMQDISSDFSDYGGPLISDNECPTPIINHRKKIRSQFTPELVPGAGSPKREDDEDYFHGLNKVSNVRKSMTVLSYSDRNSNSSHMEVNDDDGNGNSVVEVIDDPGTEKISISSKNKQLDDIPDFHDEDFISEFSISKDNSPVAIDLENEKIPSKPQISILESEMDGNELVTGVNTISMRNTLYSPNESSPDYSNEEEEEKVNLSPLEDFDNINVIRDKLKPNIPYNIRMYFLQFSSTNDDYGSETLPRTKLPRYSLQKRSRIKRIFNRRVF